MLHFHWKESTTNCMLTDKWAQCLQGSAVLCLLGVTCVPKVSPPHIPVYSCKICATYNWNHSLDELQQLNNVLFNHCWYMTSWSKLKQEWFSDTAYPSRETSTTEYYLHINCPIFFSGNQKKILLVAEWTSVLLLSQYILNVTLQMEVASFLLIELSLQLYLAVFRISSSY